MNRRQLIVVLAGLYASPSHASVVLYMAAVDPSEVPALDSNRQVLERTLLESTGDWHLYLDKAWDGLHWVLTGSSQRNAHPLSTLLLGGKSLSTQLPYGKPRLHSPEEVKRYAELLGAETEKSLRGRYLPAEMDKRDVYPGDWAEDSEERFAYLLAAFRELQSFAFRVAAANKALLCSWS